MVGPTTYCTVLFPSTSLARSLGFAPLPQTSTTLTTTTYTTTIATLADDVDPP